MNQFTLKGRCGKLLFQNNYYVCSFQSFFPVPYADKQWGAAILKAREGNRVPVEPDMSWEKVLKERLYPSGNTLDLVPVSHAVYKFLKESVKVTMAWWSKDCCTCSRGGEGMGGSLSISQVCNHQRKVSEI